MTLTKFRYELQFATVVPFLVIFIGYSSQTFAGPKCGGNGGAKTRTHTCPPGQYLMGIGDAVGGSFVHNLKFQCTDYKVSNKIGGPNPRGPFNFTRGGASCPNGMPVISIQTYCGAYVDSIRSLRCGVKGRDGKVVQTPTTRTINVGGGGGSRRSLSCPNGKAIYRVKVKYGSWIDSIEISCR